MGRKMGEKAIRVLLGHQCRSFHDKPRGGWFNAAVMWFCLQIWQPQIGQICSSHVKPIKNGVHVETMGDNPPGENSDSKTFKDQEKKHQTPCSLREFS